MHYARVLVKKYDRWASPAARKKSSSDIFPDLQNELKNRRARRAVTVHYREPEDGGFESRCCPMHLTTAAIAMMKNHLIS